MTDFDPILGIMNPRRIPECIVAFDRLDVRKAWLTGFTEWDLVDVVAQLVRDESVPFSHLIVVADDCIVPQPALEAVLNVARQGDPVVTGYCRLDAAHPDVNITRRPLMGDTPSVGAYDFWSFLEVEEWPGEVMPTGFVGFALTCMSRELWREFPFGCFGTASRGYSSDFHLSRRLRDAGIPMVAAVGGYVTHVKERWNTLDRAPEKRLLVGEVPAAVRFEG